MDNGHQTIRRDGAVYLDADGVFGCSPEPLDVEMLLHPFEEQLYLPAVLVEQGDGQSVKRQGVGQERKGPVLLLVIIDDATQDVGILLLGSISREPDNGVGDDVFRHPPLPPDRLELEVFLGPHDEERLYLVDAIQPFEVVVASVEHVESALLVWYLVHSVHVVDGSLRYVEECRNLGLQVIKRVDLNPSLRPAEAGPLVNAQAKVHGGRVEGVDVASKLKHVVDPLGTSLADHVVGVFLEDAVVPAGVSLRQVAECYAFAKAEMVALVAVGGDDQGQVSQALAVAQLAEHQDEQLVPARERLHIAVPIVLVNDVAELVAVQELG